MSHKNRNDGPGLLHHLTARVNWRSGEITPLPVLIRQPLPFGLSHEKLRQDLLRYQNDERLDGMGKDLETLWSCPGPIAPEAWAELFDDHGITPHS